MKRSKILSTIIDAGKRYINIEAFRGDNHKAKQYNPGGHDYNPPEDIEALIAKINNNNADNSVIAYRDRIVQISDKGELRIYGTSSDGITLLGSLHFKNNGNIEINIPETQKIRANNIDSLVTETHKIYAENIELDGIVDINSDSVECTTPTFTINGDLIVNGTITGTTDVIAGTISGKTHIHGGVTTGTGSTGAPT